jgi:hypothetical protein
MLQLDTKRLMKDLESELYKALERVAKNGVQYMIYELSSAPSIDSDIEEWKDDVTSALKFIGIAKANTIAVDFGLISPEELTLNRSLALNYGIGEYLDRNNPYLQEYLQSEYYNPSRDNFKVYSRPGESFYDYSEGDFKESTATSRKELTFTKLQPIHFFENALPFVINDMNEEIQKVIDSFDFSKYLIMK